jgi:hypothetical protein
VASANGRDAPIPDLPALTPERVDSAVNAPRQPARLARLGGDPALSGCSSADASQEPAYIGGDRLAGDPPGERRGDKRQLAEVTKRNVTQCEAVTTSISHRSAVVGEFNSGARRGLLLQEVRLSVRVAVVSVASSGPSTDHWTA